jgi:hypothetical protein
MTREAKSALALIVFALAIVPTPLSSDADCERKYLGFLERLGDRIDLLPGERLAHLHRGALRLLDACASGHLPNIETRLRELEAPPA